jgi:hypothetical protein
MRPLCLAALATLACAEVDSPNPVEVLPDDYRTTFVEALGCRSSSSHMNNILVRVHQDLQGVYETGPYPFPQGALVVKEEYRDPGCTDLTAYSVMRKEAPSSDPASGDWTFFKLDVRRRILEKNMPRCVSCHAQPTCRTRDRVCADP